MHQTDIILSTLNARYVHASLALRYLKSNMGELMDRTEIEEFTLDQRPIDIAEKLLSHHPRILGLGVYIWNVEQTARLVALIKSIAPEVTVVIGGPEVSYEYVEQHIVALADHTITGMADLTFARLCRDLIDGKPVPNKIHTSATPKLAELELPYRFYEDVDINDRFVYVEASRGCPFKCEFCLSALDKTAWPFDLDRFLNELDLLYQRGARHFRFVDRTFNLNIKKSARILQFFIDRLDDHLFVHFEVIPDHLPQQLKALLTKFPPGSLQLEVGIQTLNPSVQALISRRQNNDRALSNLHWLRANTHAHIHTDLIFGLPGEDVQSFARGFDRLIALRPHEIQLGILKRLRGSTIVRHSDTYAMTYNPDPPYNVLSTSLVDFHSMQRISRFSRYWDLIANSGRFKRTLPLILDDDPFLRFLELSDWIYAETRQTHRIAVNRLFDLVYGGLTRLLQADRAVVIDTLSRDRGQTYWPPGQTPAARRMSPAPSRKRQARQLRHIGGA